MLLWVVQASCVPGLMMYGVPNMKTDKMDVVQRSDELNRRSFMTAKQTKSRPRSGYYEARGHYFRHWSCWACRREHGGISRRKQHVHLLPSCIVLGAVAGAHRGYKHGTKSLAAAGGHGFIANVEFIFINPPSNTLKKPESRNSISPVPEVPKLATNTSSA